MDFIYNLIDMLPFEWVQYNFMKNALIGIILISPLLGLLGTMVVNNKMSFFSDALGHSALTGIAIGVLIGIDNYIVSMMGFAIVFALLISFVMESEVSSSDTIIGVFSSVGISIGIVLLSFSGGFSKYSSYLIGDILSIKRSEIGLLFIVLILVIAIWVVAFNKLLLSSINSDLASSKQCNVKFFKNLFMILIAIVVTVSIKWVGVLMINSLLILPAAASRNIAKNMKEYHIFSVLFSLISGICGLFISFYLGLAAAGTIVIISSFIFFITFFMNKTNK